MAQVSFDAVANDAAFNQGNNQNGPQVGFFFLKNDGDEAVVRFLHDNTDSFDLLTVHNEQVGDKTRKINCVRDAHEPIDKCPLCSRGGNTSTRFFIHLLEYKKDESGNIYCEPKVWERSLSYATQLRDLISEYGPLSNNLFKIKRNGAAGSQDTTYSIMYAAPQVYKPELYPNKPELFGDYKVLGTIVMDKNIEELNQFVNTGTFPQKATPTAQTETAQQNPVPNNAPVGNNARQTQWSQPQQGNNNPTNPTRYY